jgi:hypothetical protein
MVRDPNTASSKTTSNGIIAIVGIVGIVVLVSLVANGILGLSRLFPPIIPLWGIAVIIGSLYLLAYQERMPDMSTLIKKASHLDTSYRK